MGETRRVIGEIDLGSGDMLFERIYNLFILIGDMFRFILIAKNYIPAFTYFFNIW
jgi:hypothetical protein